jgi:hypothetical protein
MKARCILCLLTCWAFLFGERPHAFAEDAPVDAMLDKLVPKQGVSVIISTDSVETYFRKKFHLDALPKRIDLTKESVMEVHFVGSCFTNGSFVYEIEKLDRRTACEANGKLVEHDVSKTPSPLKLGLGNFWTALMKVEKFGSQPTAQPYKRSVGSPNVIIITHHPTSPQSNRMFFAFGSPAVADGWTNMILAIMGTPGGN